MNQKKNAMMNHSEQRLNLCVQFEIHNRFFYRDDGHLHRIKTIF